MKFIASMVLGASLAAAALPSSAQEILTGDTRLACEAVLCLATGQRPSECAPSIQRYFSIKFKKPGDTIRERINFLNKCPASNQSPEMATLVTAMGMGAGSCDPASLNVALKQVRFSGSGDNMTSETYIDNTLPAACKAYTQNAYTDVASLAVRYVGTPERGGYWIESAKWDAAQQAWAAKVAAEDAAAKEQAAANLNRY